jgi:hypothetical protein
VTQIPTQKTRAKTISQSFPKIEIDISEEDNIKGYSAKRNSQNEDNIKGISRKRNSQNSSRLLRKSP